MVGGVLLVLEVANSAISSKLRPRIGMGWHPVVLLCDEKLHRSSVAMCLSRLGGGS